MHIADRSEQKRHRGTHKVQRRYKNYTGLLHIAWLNQHEQGHPHGDFWREGNVEYTDSEGNLEGGLRCGTDHRWVGGGKGGVLISNMLEIYDSLYH